MTKIKNSIKNPFARRNVMKAKRHGVGIEKNLDVVLQTARNEYQQVAFSTWATQNSKLRTYLWLTVAIVSAEAALFLRMFDTNEMTGWLLAPLAILGVALVIGFGAFVFGVDCMRSRGDAIRPVRGEDYEYTTRVAETDLSGWKTRKEAITALGTLT